MWLVSLAKGLEGGPFVGEDLKNLREAGDFEEFRDGRREATELEPSVLLVRSLVEEDERGEFLAREVFDAAQVEQ